MSQTMKTIQISNMKHELLELIAQIKLETCKLNEPKRYFSSKSKKEQEKELLMLIAKKNLLEQKITEGISLE